MRTSRYNNSKKLVVVFCIITMISISGTIPAILLQKIPPKPIDFGLTTKNSNPFSSGPINMADFVQVATLEYCSSYVDMDFEVADTDQDGRMEIIFGTSQKGQGYETLHIVEFYNRTFTTIYSHTVNVSPIQTRNGHMVGDSDGDGRIEIWWGNDPVKIEECTGNNCYENVENITTQIRTTPSAMRLIDPDGLMDAVLANDTGIMIYETVGDNSWALKWQVNGLDNPEVVIADTDRDGWNELICCLTWWGPDGEMYIMECIGDDDYVHRWTSPTPNYYYGCRPVPVGDIDLDGNHEIIIGRTEKGGTGISVFESTGDNLWQLQEHIDCGDNIRRACSGNFTGDSRLNFAIGSYIGDLKIWEYDSAFNSIWSDALGEFLTVSSGDINKDNISELIIGNDITDEIIVYSHLNRWTVPYAPNLTISNPQPCDGTIQLSWTPIDLAENYTVYRHESPIVSINETVTKVIETTDLSYLDEGLDPGEYFYAIVAENLTGVSDLSNIVSSSVLILPGAPVLQQLVPNPSPGGAITFTWNSIPTAIGYRVYSYEPGPITSINGSVTLEDTTSNSETQVTISDPGVYYCAVTAYNASGESIPSNNQILVVDIEGPVIGVVSCAHDPIYEEMDQTISVSVVDAGEAGLNWTRVYYRFAGGPWTSDHYYQATGDIVTIPHALYSDGETVEYYVAASDLAGTVNYRHAGGVTANENSARSTPFSFQVGPIFVKYLLPGEYFLTSVNFPYFGKTYYIGIYLWSANNSPSGYLVLEASGEVLLDEDLIFQVITAYIIRTQDPTFSSSSLLVLIELFEQERDFHFERFASAHRATQAVLGYYGIQLFFSFANILGGISLAGIFGVISGAIMLSNIVEGAINGFVTAMGDDRIEFWTDPVRETMEEIDFVAWVFQIALDVKKLFEDGTALKQTADRIGRCKEYLVAEANFLSKAAEAVTGLAASLADFFLGDAINLIWEHAISTQILNLAMTVILQLIIWMLQVYQEFPSFFPWYGYMGMMLIWGVYHWFHGRDTYLTARCVEKMRDTSFSEPFRNLLRGENIAVLDSNAVHYYEQSIEIFDQYFGMSGKYESAYLGTCYRVGISPNIGSTFLLSPQINENRPRQFICGDSKNNSFSVVGRGVQTVRGANITRIELGGINASRWVPAGLSIFLNSTLEIQMSQITIGGVNTTLFSGSNISLGLVLLSDGFYIVQAKDQSSIESSLEIFITQKKFLFSLPYLLIVGGGVGFAAIWYVKRKKNRLLTQSPETAPNHKKGRDEILGC